MDVVIEYYDTHHYPQAEWYCLFIGESASVFPGGQTICMDEARHKFYNELITPALDPDYFDIWKGH